MKENLCVDFTGACAVCICMWYYIEVLQINHKNSVKKCSLFSIDES